MEGWRGGGGGRGNRRLGEAWEVSGGNINRATDICPIRLIGRWSAVASLLTIVPAHPCLASTFLSPRLSRRNMK